MATVSRTNKFSPDLNEAAELRRQSLGMSYNAYVTSLVRYDILVQGDHTVTGDIAALEATLRDRLDAYLLRLARKGKGERGVLLRHIVERSQERGQTLMEALLDEAARQ